MRQIHRSLGGTTVHTTKGTKRDLTLFIDVVQVVRFEKSAKVKYGILANISQPKEVLNSQPGESRDTTKLQEHLNSVLNAARNPSSSLHLHLGACFSLTLDWLLLSPELYPSQPQLQERDEPFSLVPVQRSQQRCLIGSAGWWSRPYGTQLWLVDVE